MILRRLLKKADNYIREPINAFTHGLGIVGAIMGLYFLLHSAKQEGDVYRLIAFWIFGGSMLLLYTVSTLYHAVQGSSTLLRYLRILDHTMINILIAGTYTPVCLIVLSGYWKWGFFGTIWGLALIGIAKDIFWLDRPRWFSVLFYVCMGWLAIIILPTLIRRLPLPFIIWLFVGGGAYSVGALIYAIKRPNPKPYFGFHEIWHVLVLIGTFSHYWAFYQFLTVYS